MPHRAIRPLVGLHLRAECVEDCWRRCLASVLVGHVPQLFVVLVQQDDGTGGLDMERARSMEKGVLDELDNADIGNGGIFPEVDGRAANDGCFEKGEVRSQTDWTGSL